MTIIDCQVHAYEANTPNRPWHSLPNWPDHVTGDEMVAAMDKVGVDGAIFVSAFGLYQYDASYAVEVQQAHPDRFAIVKPVNPDDPAVADVIADWKQTPGAVAIRIMLPKASGRAATILASTGSARRRPPRSAGQHPVLGQPRRRHRADRQASRHALRHRPSGHFAAARAARAAAALGRPAEGAGTRQTSERGDQGQRRLHAVTRSLIRSRTSGTRWPACSTPGVSSAACGAPTGRARSPSSTTSRPSSRFAYRPPQRQRAGHADGRRLREGLWLVAAEASPRQRDHPLRGTA